MPVPVAHGTSRLDTVQLTAEVHAFVSMHEAPSTYGPWAKHFASPLKVVQTAPSSASTAGSALLSTTYVVDSTPPACGRVKGLGFRVVRLMVNMSVQGLGGR
jgi:hypothetical protein